MWGTIYFSLWPGNQGIARRRTSVRRVTRRIGKRTVCGCPKGEAGGGPGHTQVCGLTRPVIEPIFEILRFSLELPIMDVPGILA